MSASFVHVVRSEWLKRKRSFASSLVIGGSLFTPAVVAAVRLARPEGLPKLYASAAFWPDTWRSCWESMAIFFLPLAAILATSLVAQIEFRSNAWKQVHTLPVSPASIFLSKLAVILLLLVEFLLLFTAGVYASAVLPSLVFASVPQPTGTFSSLPLWRDNALYFIACLPIVGAQYLIALRSHNALVPIGIGFTAWIGAIASVSSPHAIWWPYGHSIIIYLRGTPKGAHFAAYRELHWLALLFFITLTLFAYAAFVSRKEKG